MLSEIRRCFDVKHLIITFLLLLLAVSVAYPGQKDWNKMRERMIEEIVQDMHRSSHYTGKDRLSSEVLKAIGKVKRHLFVPDEYSDEAYENHPLPIAKGQTISQPFIVALMTELLEVHDKAGKRDKVVKVLEVGTGSGYQAAVLAELVNEVYSIEVVKDLARDASARLKKLGYSNVNVKHGDGTLGWPEEAPFDGIIVTAAGIEIPDALVEQLKPGGKMVIPLGGQFETQHLMVVTRKADGSTLSKATIPVRFVPITTLPDD